MALCKRLEDMVRIFLINKCKRLPCSQGCRLTVEENIWNRGLARSKLWNFSCFHDIFASSWAAEAESSRCKVKFKQHGCSLSGGLCSISLLWPSWHEDPSQGCLPNAESVLGGAWTTSLACTPVYSMCWQVAMCPQAFFSHLFSLSWRIFFSSTSVRNPCAHQHEYSVREVKKSGWQVCEEKIFLALLLHEDLLCSETTLFILISASHLISYSPDKIFMVCILVLQQ